MTGIFMHQLINSLTQKRGKKINKMFVMRNDIDSLFRIIYHVILSKAKQAPPRKYLNAYFNKFGFINNVNNGKV